MIIKKIKHKREPHICSYFVGVCVMFFCCLDVETAGAQSEENQQRAEELFNQGIQASGRGDHESAVQAFATSFELFAHPSTLRNLALEQEQAHQRIDAHRSWSLFLERYGSIVSDGARLEAQQRRAALEQVLARINLSSEPVGALISANGTEIGTSPIEGPLYFEPGTVEFEASLDGHHNGRVRQQLNSGENSEIIIRLEQISPTLVVNPPTENAMDSLDENPPVENVSVTDEVETQVFDEPRRSIWRRPWIWVVGGILLSSAVAIALVFTLGPDSEEIPQTDLTWRLR